MDTARRSAELVTFEDIRAAARCLEGVAHRTPVLTSRALDERAGSRIYLKCESFQRTGSFKFRGAYNRIANLNEAQRRGGVVAFSSGNHAQGIAFAGKLLGVPTAIVMPEDAPKSKIEATKAYGADVILYDRYRSHRAEIAKGICEERGATLVPPFDDPYIVAGQGTAVLELLEEAPEIETILTPTGGGGLLSGSSIAAHGINPAITLYGVEPQAGNDFQQSLQSGEIVHIDVPRTIADGLQTQAPAQLTFDIVREHARGIVTVSDEELRKGMRFAFERMKIAIEPSGAAALAAVMNGKVDLGGKPAGIVISGGNVDAVRFAELIQ